MGVSTSWRGMWPVIWRRGVLFPRVALKDSLSMRRVPPTGDLSRVPKKKKRKERNQAKRNSKSL